MALGTITVSDFAGRNNRPVCFDVLSFAGDSSYPTGGTDAFEGLLETALNYQGRKILAVVPIECGGYIPQWDAATGKLKMYYGDNNNASDGALIEVPNTTNLSAVTMKLLVISK